MKKKRTGQALAITGLILLSFNFISYLMNEPFVSMAILPIGIALLVIGAAITRHAGKHPV